MTLSRISMNSIYFKQFLLVTRNHGGRAMSGMRPAAAMPRDSKTENKKLQQHQRGRTEYDLSKFMTPTGMAHNLKLTKPESAKVMLEQVAPTSLLRKMLDTVRTSELRVSHVVERVTPVLVAVQNRLLTPMYRTLRVKLTQLHERPLAQELAQRFGPGVVTRLQRLQHRDVARKLGQEQHRDGASKLSKEQQLDVASKLGQEQHRDGARKLGQEQQRDGASKVTADYKSRDSHQDLLTVRSRAPLLSRMISTLSQMIEEKAKPVNSGATQHQSIQK